MSARWDNPLRKGRDVPLSDVLLHKDDVRPAIVTEHEVVTYWELGAAVAGFAAHLHEMGIAKCDRVAFSDSGAKHVIGRRRDTSMSANIILRSVDNFHTEYRRGKPTYCMDFLYNDYVDIKAFLLKNKETVE